MMYQILWGTLGGFCGAGMYHIQKWLLRLYLERADRIRRDRWGIRP